MRLLVAGAVHGRLLAARAGGFLGAQAAVGAAAAGGWLDHDCVGSVDVFGGSSLRRDWLEQVCVCDEVVA